MCYCYSGSRRHGVYVRSYSLMNAGSSSPPQPCGALILSSVCTVIVGLTCRTSQPDENSVEYCMKRSWMDRVL